MNFLSRRDTWETESFFDLKETRVLENSIISGKGSSLCELNRLGYSVPPGFIMSSSISNHYGSAMQLNQKHCDSIIKHVADIETQTGRTFSGCFRSLSTPPPLLLTVRVGSLIETCEVTKTDVGLEKSAGDEGFDNLFNLFGASESMSMPGLQSTICGIGLNDEVVAGLSLNPAYKRYALGIYAEFLMQYSTIILNKPKEPFNEIISRFVDQLEEDALLPIEHLEAIIREFKSLSPELPNSPGEQLQGVIRSAYTKWWSEDAKYFRSTLLEDADRFPSGIALIVQQHIFGGTGTIFSRSPVTGVGVPCGQFYPMIGQVKLSLDDLMLQNLGLYKQLEAITSNLERLYRDMQCVEFAIQETGEIFLLQCRTGHRTPAASIRIAVDMVAEGLLTEREAIQRLKFASTLNFNTHESLNDFMSDDKSFTPGSTASPGLASGVLVLCHEDCDAIAMEHKIVLMIEDASMILDPQALKLCAGVVCVFGNIKDKVAIQCRTLGIPCIVGLECTAKFIADDRAKRVVYTHAGTSTGNLWSSMIDPSTMSTQTIYQGGRVTLDASNGKLYPGALSHEELNTSPYFTTVCSWAERYSKLQVYARVSSIADEEMLCSSDTCVSGCTKDGVFISTDYMFSCSEERLTLTRAVLVADNDVSRNMALANLREVQRNNFKRIFQSCVSVPIYISLLDCSLDRFLPPLGDNKEMIELASHLHVSVSQMRAVMKNLKDENPNVGLRGCRITGLIPQITEMQVQAIVLAQIDLIDIGLHHVRPNIAVTFASTSREVDFSSKLIDRVAKEVWLETQMCKEIDHTCPFLGFHTTGAMANNLRCCLRAETFAEVGSFMIFDSDSLTEQLYGCSKKDARKYLTSYLSKEMYMADPYTSLDDKGVGYLIADAVKRSHEVKKGFTCGVVGNHCYNSRSMNLFNDMGLKFVASCPSQIGLVKLFAAQSNISNSRSSFLSDDMDVFDSYADL